MGILLLLPLLALLQRDPPRDSAEAILLAREIIGRARFGAAAQPLVDGFGLSDIAIVEERFETDRLQLVGAILPSTTLTRGARAGIYFEVYGVAEDENLQVRLESEPLNRSFVQRIFGALRVRNESPPLRVTWQEGVERSDQKMVRRMFLLDTSSLPDGVSRLSLSVTRANGSTARVERRVTIRG